jgi:hypothetical protein
MTNGLYRRIGRLERKAGWWTEYLSQPIDQWPDDALFAFIKAHAGGTGHENGIEAAGPDPEPVA